MNLVAILAEAKPVAENAAQHNGVVPVQYIFNQIVALNWLEAIIAVSFGVVYLMYGWRIFKAIAVTSFGLLGLYIGMEVGGKMGHMLAGGIVGLLVLAGACIPLMRWAVSILGGVAGGIFTAGLWYACMLPEKYIWAGALIGLIAGAMISFIVFKIAVMLFTSMGGAAIMVAGMLALLHHYGPTQVQIDNYILNCKWFLPLAITIPTVVGILTQNRLVKGSKGWEI